MKLHHYLLDNIFITSDTHAFHVNLCRGTTAWTIDRQGDGNQLKVRDFDTPDQMTEQLAENFNDIIPENAILFHLGDWSFAGKQNIERFRRMLNVRTIHLITGNHDCFDSETEFLTNRGWLKYEDIADDYLLASMNTDNHDISFNRPISRHSSYYKGSMYKVKGLRTDLLITPNHKLYYNLPTWKHKHNLKEISNIPLTNTIIGMYGAGNNSNKDFDISDDIIKLTAWIITDGSVKVKPKGINYVLYQSPKKVGHIKQLLTSLNISFREEIRVRNILSIAGKILKKPTQPQHILNIHQGSTLEQYIQNKYVFPEWVYKLSKRQFDLFLEAFVLGDGTKHKQNPNTSWVVYGKKEVLDQLQHLCVVNGHKTSLRGYRERQWVLNININNPYFQLSSMKKSTNLVEYEGIINCFQTTDGTLIVRRNGKVSITGNSHIVKGDYDHLFTSRQAELKLQVGGILFHLYHHPISSWDALGAGAYHLHGHQHWTGDKRFGNGKKMDVGVDGNDLKPYRLLDVIDLLKDRVHIPEGGDHHA